MYDVKREPDTLTASECYHPHEHTLGTSDAILLCSVMRFMRLMWDANSRNMGRGWVGGGGGGEAASDLASYIRDGRM